MTPTPYNSWPVWTPTPEFLMVFTQGGFQSTNINVNSQPPLTCLVRRRGKSSSGNDVPRDPLCVTMTQVFVDITGKAIYLLFSLTQCCLLKTQRIATTFERPKPTLRCTSMVVQDKLVWWLQTSQVGCLVISAYALRWPIIGVEPTLDLRNWTCSH